MIPITREEAISRYLLVRRAGYQSGATDMISQSCVFCCMHRRDHSGDKCLFSPSFYKAVGYDVAVELYRAWVGQ